MTVEGAALFIAILAFVASILIFVVIKSELNKLKSGVSENRQRTSRKLELLDQSKPDLIKNGKVRHFQDDEGNIFGKHIITEKK